MPVVESSEEEDSEYEGSPFDSDGEEDHTKPSGKVWEEMLIAFKEAKKVKETLGSILPMPEFGKLQVSEKPPEIVSGKPKLLLKSPADFMQGTKIPLVRSYLRVNFRKDE